MIIKSLSLTSYEQVWRDMQHFTQTRTQDTPDEIWLTEHLPVYTLGLNGKREHLLKTGDIPVVQTDRGGQVTYHAPGQAIVYFLLDLKRLHLNSQQMVSLLENAMIQTLRDYHIHAQADAKARGVYVQSKKIGSIGLRIKQNGCYHGLSLNNQLDLKPFTFINPCGYANLQMTQVSDFHVFLSTQQLCEQIATHFINTL